MRNPRGEENGAGHTRSLQAALHSDVPSGRNKSVLADGPLWASSRRACKLEPRAEMFPPMACNSLGDRTLVDLKSPPGALVIQHPVTLAGRAGQT